MNLNYHKIVFMKRLVLYIIGLFCLSLGASFSIQALLGVAPVSSLPYAFSLSTGLSIGVTTVIANFIFIVIQIILNKKQVELKDYSVQLIIAFLFGFFMEASLFLVQLLPEPAFVIARFGYLMISLFLVSIGLLSYFTSKLLSYAMMHSFEVPLSLSLSLLFALPFIRLSAA